MIPKCLISLSDPIFPNVLKLKKTPIKGIPCLINLPRKPQLLKSKEPDRRDSPKVTQHQMKIPKVANNETPQPQAADEENQQPKPAKDPQ